jgi:ribonuclease HII
VYHRRFFAPVAAARERHQTGTISAAAQAIETSVEVEVSAAI